jgi:hypothetical protein
VLLGIRAKGLLAAVSMRTLIDYRSMGVEDRQGVVGRRSAAPARPRSGLVRWIARTLHRLILVPGALGVRGLADTEALLLARPLGLDVVTADGPA